MADKNWLFAIRGESTDTLDIDVYDEIGKSWWNEDAVSAKDVRDKLKEAKGVKTINLRVNSGGGGVFEGLAIYNLLNQHPAKVVAHVDALAASMASVIIMAADEIHISESALVMVHAPWSYAVGNADEMREQADLLDKLKGQLIDIYVARNGKIDRDKISELVDAETWMTGQEAVDQGFADKVVKSKAKASVVASLNLSGFQNMPAVFARAAEDAVKQATEEKKVQAPPAPKAETPPAPLGGSPKEKRKNMDENELKAQHPALYDALVAKFEAAGAAREQKRVSAHLKMAEKTGANDVAFAAIKDGKSVQDDDVFADYMTAAHAKRDTGNRQADSDAAGNVVAGAKPAVEAEEPADMGDAIMALRAKKGAK